MSRRTRRGRAGSAGIFAATLVMVAFLALGDGPTGTSRVLTSIDPPAPPGSTCPALAAEGATTVSKGHDLLMTWLEPAESGERLSFARLSGQTWSPPITVAEHVSTLDATDRPSLTVIETRSVRRTLIARTGDIVARSGDAGRTWTRLPSPALPFASFAGGDEGAYVFWLGAGQDGSAKLLGTRVLAGETLLDPQVAGDSGTSAAMTWDGPVVVYRDGGTQGPGGIAIVRRQDARWASPLPLHAEARVASEAGSRAGSGPGPVVAALRRRVAVAWAAEATSGPRLLVAFSGDAGRTFGAPVEALAGEEALVASGSLDVTLDDEGHALLLWRATPSPGRATLHLARVTPEGRRGESLVLARGLSTAFEGIAQIARVGDRVAVAWVEGDPGSAPGGGLRRVRAVTIALADIPVPDGRGPAAAGEPSQVYTGHGRVGEPVPDLPLVSLDGEEVSLASLRGRAVLLNLWATWCLPCLEEMPDLAALQERHGSEGLVVVGLNVDSADATEKVHAFVSERKIPFGVWLDPEMRLYGALRVRSLPATFVIDREGRIVLRRDGVIAAGDPEIQEALRRALSGSS